MRGLGHSPFFDNVITPIRDASQLGVRGASQLGVWFASQLGVFGVDVPTSHTKKNRRADLPREKKEEKTKCVSNDRSGHEDQNAY